MGNREDLLTAAKRCLHEKGFARTTARDIASAAGVSLAAIGYHYGTKEALLSAALYQTLEEWGDALEEMAAASASPGATPAERFETAWTEVLRSFAANRPLWVIQFELVAHIERHPELRRNFAEASQHARLGLVELFGDFGQAKDEQQALLIGAVYQALLVGVASQWLVDPDSAPSGRDLRDGLQKIAAGIGGAIDTTRGRSRAGS